MTVVGDIVRPVRVTPIGSCRIATPLKTAAKKFGFSLSRGRSFGFSHSSAEAVQQVKFMLGQCEPPADIWPLLSQSDRDAVQSEQHDASDVYVVEVCSGKELRIGDWLIQLNYLVRQFPEFFGDVARKGAFWRLTERGDQAAIDDFLANEWSSTPAQVQECAVLRQISLHLATEQDVERDMRWLASTLPNVVFVSHVDALRADGTPIPARSAFISKVVTVAHKMGARIINPTYALVEWGQDQAMEADSPSLAHYTDAFSDHVGDLIYLNGVSDAWIADLAHKGNFADLSRYLAALEDQGHLGASLGVLMQNQVDPVVSLLAMRAAAYSGDVSAFQQLISRDVAERLPVADLRSVAALCAQQDQIGMLAQLNECAPDALSDLPFLVKARVQNLEPDSAASDANLVDTIDRLLQQGHAAAALASIQPAFPELKSNAEVMTALKKRLPRLIGRLVHEVSVAELAEAFKVFDALDVPEITVPLVSHLAQIAKEHIRAARQSDGYEDLADFVSGLGEVAASVPELPRDFAYLALTQRDNDVALKFAKLAQISAPDDVQSAVVAMRAASNLGQLSLLEANAKRVCRLVTDPEARYRVEAEKRLTALPRAYYNKAANEPSNLTALQYYRSAAAAHDLAERANKQAVLREKAFLAEARDRLIAGDDTLEDDLKIALKILGQHPRVLFLRGRFLVMRSRFEDALPIWQQLLALAPDDDKAKLELQRCQDKLGLADV